MKPWKGRLQRMPQRGCLGNGRCSPISSFWLVQAVRRQPGGCPSRPAFNILQKEIEVINQRAVAQISPFWREKCLGMELAMMGHWQKQTELWVEPINLGRRIPPDHLLRKIDRVLDLGFVRREVTGFYGSNGHVSVDPVIIIKLMLLLFLDDVRSERELMRIVPLRLDYLWFLGYGLEDEIPTHRCIEQSAQALGMPKSLSGSLPGASSSVLLRAWSMAASCILMPLWSRRMRPATQSSRWWFGAR